MNNRREIHDRVLNAADKKELMAAYSEWAEKYDNDLIDNMGYVAPVIAGELLLKHINRRDADILDAGCGTGLVGAFLSEQGFLNITGLDYSEEMLEKAEEKSVYKALCQGDLTGTLVFADNRFDAVICVGTFTCGHVGPEAFQELVRIIKPGGVICFTVRDKAWEDDDYRTEITKLEQKNAWKLLEEKTTDYIQQEGASCNVCLYRITG